MTHSVLRSGAVSALVTVLGACSAQATEPAERVTSEIGTPPHVEVDAIVMGEGHMCALLRDATVRCFGGAQMERFCQPCGCEQVPGAGGWSSAERSIPGLEGVVQLSAAKSHTCAVIRDGSVRCWGGTESVLSTGANNPVIGIAGITDVVAITTTFLRTCAVLVSGNVRCWGGPVAANDPNNVVSGWFGAEEITSSPAPSPPPGSFDDPETPDVISTTCVRGHDGTVGCKRVRTTCSGAKLRDNLFEDFFLPGLRSANRIAAAPTIVCGSVGDQLRCGREDVDATDVATVTEDGTAAPGRVAMRGSLMCIVEGGKVSCLAHRPTVDGREEQYLAPRRVEGVEDVVAVAMGKFGPRNTCALRRDSSIVCWETGADGSARDLAAPICDLPPENR